MLYNSRVFAQIAPPESSVFVFPSLRPPYVPEGPQANHGRRNWPVSLVSASKIGSLIAGPFITLLPASCWSRVFSPE